jgi:hypothetical protein
MVPVDTERCRTDGSQRRSCTTNTEASPDLELDRLNGTIVRFVGAPVSVLGAALRGSQGGGR